MTVSFRKPPLLPTCLMLIGVTVLCSLGMWQMKRLAWKTTLITEYEAAKTSNVPIDLKTIRDDPLFMGGVINVAFSNTNHTYTIEPRTFDGTIGKYVYTPLRIDSDTYIFANLGWSDRDTPVVLPDTLPRTLKVIIKRAERPNAFTPENRPDSWVWPDLTAMADDAKISDIITTHYAILQTPITDTIIPIGQSERPPFKNDHAQYAFFWFTMAAVLVVIFTMRFVVVRDSDFDNTTGDDAA